LVTARGLKDGNPFTQRSVQQATYVRLQLQTKFVEKIKIHILYYIKFFENRDIYEINWKNIVDPAGHRRHYNKAHAHCLLDT